MPGYSFVENLLTHQPVPEEGILTRQVFDDDTLRVVLFTFSAGQRLSEHTTSTTALMHFLSGDAVVTLGSDTISAGTGTWVRMEPGLAHSIIARSPVVMLLVLIKAASREAKS